MSAEKPKKAVAKKPIKKLTKAKKPENKRVKHPYMLGDKEWDKHIVMGIICDAIATSSKSIASILAAGHEGNTLPGFSTIARWLADEEDKDCFLLREQYARAKEAQADFMAEEMAELHEKAWVPIILDNGEPLKDREGNLIRTVNKASAAAVRLEADNKKWLMSKLKPKKYGDKIENTHSSPSGGAIQLETKVVILPPKTPASIITKPIDGE